MILFGVGFVVGTLLGGFVAIVAIDNSIGLLRRR
jgi:hypothetical protein